MVNYPASVLRDATIVFDLDGTLLDTAPDLANALNAVLARHGIAQVPAEAFRPWVALGARYMVDQALRRTGAKANPEQILSEFLRQYDLHIADATQPFPGAVEALEALQDAGARLAVCTTKREHYTRKLLKALSLDSYFAGVAGGDTFPHRKPHPSHLQAVIALAGGRPDHSVMVGDSEVDVATARAAAVPVIGVSFGYSERPVAEFEPDVIIDHFDALIPCAQRLLARAKIE